MPDFAALAEACYEAWLRDRPEAIAIDTETTGVSWSDRPFCVTLAWPGESHYIELEDLVTGFDYAEEILEATPTWVFHNAKFDLQKLILRGVITRDMVYADRLEDTEALAHLLDENRPKGLKALAVSVLHHDDTIEVPIKSGPKQGQMRKVTREKHELSQVRKKLGLRVDDGYHVLPREVIIPYAIRDAEFTWRLYEMLSPAVRAIDDLSALYRREMALTLVLLDMEAKGMRIDVPYVTNLAKEFFNRAVAIEGKIRMLVNDGEFNPRSQPQLLAALNARGFDITKTDEDTLIRLDDPLADLTLEYRSIMKKLNTYLEALLKEHKDGIVHPNFRQHGARTGRMSSGGASN